MRANDLLKSSLFKLISLSLVFVVLCYFFHANESMSAKAKRISFPGMTQVNLNRSMKTLTLEKLGSVPSQPLLKNMAEHQLKLISPLFLDKNNSLMVVIAESSESQLVFALIKNDQVTQLQRINEITNKDISLQYGKIILNSQSAVATTQDAPLAL